MRGAVCAGHCGEQDPYAAAADQEAAAADQEEGSKDGGSAGNDGGDATAKGGDASTTAPSTPAVYVGERKVGSAGAARVGSFDARSTALAPLHVYCNGHEWRNALLRVPCQHGYLPDLLAIRPLP